MKKTFKEITKAELQMLKECIRYDSETGVFHRKFGKMGVVKLCWANVHGTVPLQNKTRKKYFTAWRCAVYAVYGYYPNYSDSVIFKDGDNRNLKIDNILVLRPSESEQTIMDFAIEHNLSPQTVNVRMQDMPRVSRMVYRSHVYFYEKSDFIRQCGDMIGRTRRADYDTEVIIVKPVNIDRQPRKNKMIRDFLAYWHDSESMPKTWGMTLC